MDKATLEAEMIERTLGTTLAVTAIGKISISTYIACSSS